jgi:very-short-patch-repair endonuclease
VGERSKQNLNPPQSPLVRGDDDQQLFAGKKLGGESECSSSTSGESVSTDAPPLIRGGWEGLGFIPYDPKLTALARANRKNPTPAEQKIWFEVLRARQFSAYKFLRQKPIARFIVDFYYSSLRWVIEIDGDSHAENPAYDIERTQMLQRYGLTVIRYANHDVMHNISGVYDDLAGRLH